MTEKITCPICQGPDGSWPRYPKLFECVTCGRYSIDESLGPHLKATDDPRWDLTPVQRAVLAHQKYQWDQSPTSISDAGYPYLFKVDDDRLAWIRDHGALPSRAEQATNLIRFVGGEISHSGANLEELPKNIHTIIGTVSLESACELAAELREQGLFRSGLRDAPDSPNPQSTLNLKQINLSLDGWERYEAEQRGRFAGNYGFMALQFDNDELKEFVRDVVKPTVKEATDVVDLRDVSKAGLIDNLIVTQIRDARFVIADLTDDNRGAYWEAGYAEGLGKPVIYICKKEKS